MFSKFKAIFRSTPKERRYAEKISTFIFENPRLYTDKKHIGKICRYYEKWIAYTRRRSYPFEREVLSYIAMRLFWSNIEDSNCIRKLLYWSREVNIHFIDFIFPGPENFVRALSPDFAMHFVEFFLRHATKNRLIINKFRIEDLLVIRPPQVLRPCEIALASGSPEVLLLFLRYGAYGAHGAYGAYGAYGEFTAFHMLKLVKQIIQIMLELKMSNTWNNKGIESARCTTIIQCGKTIMRVCPQLNKHLAFKTRRRSFPSAVYSIESWKWIINNILPELESRIFQPLTLKQMCRLKIRGMLYKKWLLPDGIMSLPLPKYLKNYLDLLHD